MSLVKVKVHLKRRHAPGAREGMGLKMGRQLDLYEMEITIPTMDWEQIGGDMNPGTYGGTIARADGDTIELVKIQPVREHVGDEEAKDVGFPFWTREASFDANDLDPNSRDVQSALKSIGISLDALEADFTPERRAIVIAEALLDYGRADEGPSGWSADLGIPDQVKWWGDKVAGAEYLADEDDAFRNDVLGYDEIRTALEETAERMADESSAMAWSTAGDQLLSDLEAAGYDPESVVDVAEFGDAVAVNGDIVDESLAKVEGDLERDGYELTKFGGRIPSDEAEVSAEHVVRAVAEELDRDEETVEEAAKSFDWWQKEIPWSTSGDTSVWARRKAGVEEHRMRASAPVRRGAAHGLEWHRSRDSFVGTVDGARMFLVDPSTDGDWILWAVDPNTGFQTRKISRYPTAADAKEAARHRSRE